MRLSGRRTVLQVRYGAVVQLVIIHMLCKTD
jgi:hypothetical protein